MENEEGDWKYQLKCSHKRPVYERKG